MRQAHAESATSGLAGRQTEHALMPLPEGVQLLHGVTDQGAGKGLRQELIRLNRTMLTRFIALVHSLTLPPLQQPQKVLVRPQSQGSH